MVKFLYLITFIILCEINFISIFAQQQSNKNDGKFNPAKDAQDLRTAIEGIGTDEKTIIQILTSRTYSQRAQIATAYYQQFQKNLVKDLKNDLSGTLRQVVVALMEEPGEFLAKELNRALTSLKKEENTVAEILCTREKIDINHVSDKYNYLFNKSLLSTIQENLSGDYKTFLETVITPPVRERGLVNSKLIAEQVQYFPGESKSCGSENVKFMEFLGKSNYEQIRHVLMNFENQYNTTVESVLEQYCSKPLLYGYRTTVQFAKSQPMFFARSINKAVIGVGTQDDTLIRIIVSRKEIDLSDIKHSYFHLYQTPLLDSIASETSGDYKKILLALIGEEK